MIVLKSIHFYLFCEKEKFSLSYDNRPCGENFGQQNSRTGADRKNFTSRILHRSENPAISENYPFDPR